MPFAKIGQPIKPSVGKETTIPAPMRAVPDVVPDDIGPMFSDADRQDDGATSYVSAPNGQKSAPSDWRQSRPLQADAAPIEALAVSAGSFQPDSLLASAGASLAGATDYMIQHGQDAGQARLASSAALGLVQDIASRADAAARTAIPTATDGQASQIWADLIELLTADGLEPVIYCSRSGRRLSDIDPLPWRDHLTAIHALGNSQIADSALMRLYTAITSVVGNTIAPPLLVTSQESMALLRELHPVDFVMVAMGRLIPPVPKSGNAAQSIGLAVRAQLLGAIRRDCELLPRPVVEYLAECLTMYLAHVSPRKVPLKHSALAYYHVEGWQRCLASPASVSHLCNRLILTLWQLIQVRRVRPSAHLTLSDLRGLRVHWSSLAEYQNQRAMRQVIRATSFRFRADLAGIDPTTGKGVRLDNNAVAGLGSAVLGFDLADLLDMQSALRMTGRKVPIAVHSAAEHTTLTRRRADIERMARDLFQEDAPSDAPDSLSGELDLSSIAMSGALDDAFNAVAYENPADLLGLESDDELFALLYAQEAGEDDDTGDDDEDGDGLAYGLDAMSDADAFAFGDDDDDTAELALDAAPDAFARFTSKAEDQATLLERAIRDARPAGAMGFRRLAAKT